MTKSELIARLAQRYPQLVAKDAEYAVKMILDAMTQALLSGHRIDPARQEGVGLGADTIRFPGPEQQGSQQGKPSHESRARNPYRLRSMAAVAPQMTYSGAGGGPARQGIDRNWCVPPSQS